MDQGTQQAPGQKEAPVSGTASKKSTKIWLWIIGGCLIVALLVGAVIVALGWWGARKVKKSIEENQPKWEEMQEGMEKWQEEAGEWEKEWQEEMEKMQEQVPEDAAL